MASIRLEKVKKNIVVISLDKTNLTFTDYNTCFYNSKTKKFKIEHKGYNYYCGEDQDYYINDKCFLLNKSKKKEAVKDLIKLEINRCLLTLDSSNKIVEYQKDKINLLTEYLLNDNYIVDPKHKIEQAVTSK